MESTPTKSSNDDIQRLAYGNLFDIDIDRLREEFRTYRVQRRLSQFDAARLLHVSQATISAFEHGKHKAPRTETLLEIRKIVDFWKRSSDGAPDHADASNSFVSVTGHSIEPTCPECGMESGATARYCSQCGFPLTEMSAGERSEVDRRIRARILQLIESGEMAHSIRQLLDGLIAPPNS